VTHYEGTTRHLSFSANEKTWLFTLWGVKIALRNAHQNTRPEFSSVSLTKDIIISRSASVSLSLVFHMGCSLGIVTKCFNKHCQMQADPHWKRTV